MVDDYYHNYRREVFEIVPKGASRILEIGCAAGRFRLNFGDWVEYWGVEPVEDAKEILRQYNKATYSGLIAILVFAVIQAIRLGMEHNYMLIGKAAAAIAVVVLFGWMFGGFKNKEIARLSKLVKHEDEKNEASM